MIITTAEVATLSGISASDARLVLAVAAVNRMATRSRSLLRATYIDILPGYGRDIIFLRESPIHSLTEVRIDSLGEFGDDTVITDLTEFAFNTRTGDDDCRLHYLAGVFPEGPRVAKVTYVAGYYATADTDETHTLKIPDDLREELIGEALERYYAGLGTERFKSESQGAWSATRFDSGSDPKRRAVFRRYRI